MGNNDNYLDSLADIYQRTGKDRVPEKGHRFKDPQESVARVATNRLFKRSDDISNNACLASKEETEDKSKSCQCQHRSSWKNGGSSESRNFPFIVRGKRGFHRVPI